MTIGMAADEKSADRLIDFIKSDNVAKGYEREAHRARFAAIGGLQYVLVDQKRNSGIGRGK